MKNWNNWYEENKSILLVDFTKFVEKHKIGDMDLNTYCRYRYFVYQNEDKLKETYVQNKKEKGQSFLDAFDNEEIYRLSVFAQIVKQDEENNVEQGIAWKFYK